MKTEDNLTIVNTDAALYPIRAVSRLTGVGLHTLRAWEKRYGVVTPIRDERGRLYTKADIERLRLLNLAVENGHSIGRLASLTTPELRELAANSTPVSVASISSSPPPVSARQAPASLRDAVDRLDHAAAERELGLMAAVMSPRDLIHQVALPLLREIGSLWHEGKASIAHEHMTSALLRNLLGGLISRYHRQSAQTRLLFATPTGELHEFGLLVSATLAAAGGLGITYLGANLPADQIVSASLKIMPRVVVLGFVGSNGARAGLGDLEQVAQKLPGDTEIWVGGTADETIVQKVRRTRAILIEDFQSFERHLIRLGARF